MRLVGRKVKQPKDEALKEFFRSISLVTQIGLTMVFAIGLGFAAGYFADRWLGTGYVFLIVGICLGIGAGFWNVYRVLMRGFVPPSSPDERAESNDEQGIDRG